MRGHVASWGWPRTTSRMVKPAAGPSAMATAIARLASVTGLGSYVSSSPYKTEICLQSAAAGPAAGQVDGGNAQVGPEQVVTRGRLMALAEDEVLDLEDVGRPGLEQFGLGHGQGQAGIADLVLGPGQALGHGGVRHEEGGRDLRGGQPADRPQRQGDPRLR